MDSQFTPTEPVMNAPLSDEVKKSARSQFSRLGLIYVIGAVLIAIVQNLAFAIVNQINPALLSDTNYSLITVMLPVYVIAMPLMLFLTHKFVPAKHIEKKKMTVGQWITVFLISFAGMYLSNIIGIILTQIIGLIKGSAVTNAMVDLSTSTNLWVNVILMVLIAPVFEEFIFRKFLIDRTVKYGEGVAVLFSGLMFGLFHGNLNQFAYAFVLGIIFAYVYVKTGNVVYTIILHMVINFMGSVLGVLILKLSGLDGMLKVADDTAALTTYMMSHLPQFMIYMVYCLILITAVIAGIILFIVNAKKIHFAQGEVTIPKGSRFSTTILNVGMILYFTYWIVMIIMQLFQ